MTKTIGVLFLVIGFLASQAQGQKTPALETKKAPKTISLSHWEMGARLWQEKNALNNADGSSYAIKGDFYGITFGYQKTNYQKGASFRHEVYAFAGQSNIESADAGVNYLEKGVAVLGGGISETVLWLAERATAEYGLNLDLFYRRAVFAEPAAGASITNANRFLIILGPMFRWKVSGRVSLEQRIGYSPQAQDVMWNFGFAYRGPLW